VARGGPPLYARARDSPRHAGHYWRLRPAMTLASRILGVQHHQTGDTVGSGSAFTAQIGTMRVNEEIDAMQTMGLNTVDVLVLPRVLALVITLPFLTFYADVMAMIGGAMMCYVDLGISIPAFMRQLQGAVTINTFIVGLVKAPVFAFVIGLVGCFEGLNVERNAGSVGRLTTRSVVESVFLVIVLDAGFSIMFSILGI